MARSQIAEQLPATDSLEPGYYKITKLITSNIIEIENTWFVKLLGIDDQTEKKELEKWLSEGNLVKIIPRHLSNDARIVSDVWLGNIHINQQFSNYNNHE